MIYRISERLFAFILYLAIAFFFALSLLRASEREWLQACFFLFFALFWLLLREIRYKDIRRRATWLKVVVARWVNRRVRE